LGLGCLLILVTTVLSATLEFEGRQRNGSAFLNAILYMILQLPEYLVTDSILIVYIYGLYDRSRDSATKINLEAARASIRERAIDRASTSTDYEISEGVTDQAC
jgi:hypothetical protein